MENKNYLYWSFQSVHDKELVVGSKEFESFKLKYKKNFETRELYSDVEVLEKYNMNGWRNPLYSKITSLILAKEHNGELVVRYITGEEKDLLQTFTNILRNKCADHTLVHFASEIVLPYITIRLERNNFKTVPHKDLQYRGLRPWNLTGFCLKDYYKGAGDYVFSLEEIANNRGIDHNFIHYDSEYNYYHSEDFKALKDSAINKVVTLASVHQDLFNLPRLEYKLFEEMVEEVQEEKPLNWLKELEKANELSLEIFDGIKEQILSAKRKPTKKDKEVIFETIKSVYIRADFENRDQDTKKVIELKEKQITDLINSL